MRFVIFGFSITRATEVVIRVPPAAPTTIRTSPDGVTMIVGLIEDIGRLPGAIKLAGDGGIP